MNRHKNNVSFASPIRISDIDNLLCLPILDIGKCVCNLDHFRRFYPWLPAAQPMILKAAAACRLAAASQSMAFRYFSPGILLPAFHQSPRQCLAHCQSWHSSPLLLAHRETSHKGYYPSRAIPGSRNYG